MNKKIKWDQFPLWIKIVLIFNTINAIGFIIGIISGIINL